MKILLSLASLLSICCAMAQENYFEHTVKLIQKKVSCCSVPFSASTDKKVDSITIEKNGSISLFYSDNKPKQTFNLFDLYQEDAGASGIDTIMGGKFIQFYVKENRVRLIRFATAADAKEVYNAFLQLIKLGKKETKMFSDLNFQQTVDVINIRLSKWSEKGNPVRIIALNNGYIIVANKGKQTLRFNLFDLKDENIQKNHGIETLACDPRAHAPLAWINFKSVGGTIGFIRLDCNTPNPELDIIRRAFIHLKSLCTKFAASNNPPYEALYFVNRNAVFKTENKMLQNSIRSVDKYDGGTIVSVSSNGEGWLDKDSLPIGKWNFYSKNEGGKEYLLKTGTYLPTKPEMFKVMGIDSTDLAKKYQLSFYALQQRHVQTVPFIKAKAWNYYHPNGSLWKTVYYRNTDIPITTHIVMMDSENNESTRLVIELKKDRMDEWPE